MLTWFKTSFNYQYQSQITVTSPFYPGVPPNQADNVPNHSVETISQIRANLTLNALSLRLYLNSPWSFVWKKVASNIFFGGGLGASWQSWYNIRYLQNLRGVNTNTPISLQGITYPHQPQVIANVFPTADAGITLTSVYPNSPYTLQFGIKFNYWGSARNIVNFENSSSYKFIQNNWKIHRIYQWAPYAGFQWNFSPKKYTYYPHKIRDNNIYRFFPFWVRIKQLENNQGLWAGFNVGKSFLFLDEVKGNFIATDGGLLSSSFFAGTNAPMRGRLVYNSSPLYEYSMGYTLNPCLQLGVALQHQGGITIQTKSLNLSNLDTNNRPNDNRAFFSSNLSFNSIALKLYLYSPWPMVSLGVAVNPYIALGAGYGFQTWNQTQVNYTTLIFNTVLDNEMRGYIYEFKQTFCPNVLATGDAGLLFQSAKPHSAFSFRLACRFNYWGQARNIGALSKQGTVKIGFFKPFSIRGIYQLAPYGGVQWTF